MSASPSPAGDMGLYLGTSRSPWEDVSRRKEPSALLVKDPGVDVVVKACHSTLGRLRHEGGDLEASLGNTERSCLKTNSEKRAGDVAWWSRAFLESIQ